MFQIVHFQKLLEGQCLNRIKLTAPLYILLGLIGDEITPKIMGGEDEGCVLLVSD